MKRINLWIKMLTVAVVLLALRRYDVIAEERAALVAENEAAVAEAEAYNRSVERQMMEEARIYEDGTFFGEGTGFGGIITVSVTIQEDEIKEITVLSADKEDPAYFQQAEMLLSKMVRAQSPETDTVSGATFSSRGLIEAVTDALRKAVRT